MKLVVFSDVHGYKEIVDRIIEFNPDADYLISLGDTELDLEYLVERDVIMIKGNYPRDPGFVYERDLDVEDKKIYLTHGHKYKVGRGVEKLVKNKIGKGYDLILFGHTHIAFIQKMANMMIINPGSCVKPRNNLPPTYLVITLEEGEFTYTFKDSFTNTTIEV